MTDGSEPQPGVSEQWVKAVIVENNDHLLHQMKQILKESVTDIKRNSSALSEVQTREFKRLKFSDHLKFKKLGNEDQYKFNTQLQDNLEEASSSLRNHDPAKCLKLIDEGMDLIKVRQKHILLADQSPSGWAVVQQYKQHDLADDSDDERKIFQAETRAKAKVAELRKKRSSNKSVTAPKPLQDPHPTVQNVSYAQQLPQAQTSKPRGPCYACGKFGHLRSSCPALQKTLPN